MRRAPLGAVGCVRVSLLLCVDKGTEEQEEGRTGCPRPKELEASVAVCGLILLGLPGLRRCLDHTRTIFLEPLLSTSLPWSKATKNSCLRPCQPGLCLFLAREEVQGCLLCYAQSTCQRDHRESGSLCHICAAAVPLSSAAVRGPPAVSWWPRWDHGAAVTACVPRMALSVTAEQMPYAARTQIPCLGSESVCRDLPVSPRACGFLLCSITVSSWNGWK